jgi:hypothetical protein
LKMPAELNHKRLSKIAIPLQSSDVAWRSCGAFFPAFWGASERFFRLFWWLFPIFRSSRWR